MRGCLPRCKVASRGPASQDSFNGSDSLADFASRFLALAGNNGLMPMSTFYGLTGHLQTAPEELLRVLNQYLSWQFRGRLLHWEAVKAEDSRRYAALRCRVLCPKSVNDTLSILRQFLRFMHLRGECSPALVLAVPTVADYGNRRIPGVLDEGQRRKFLAAFDRRSGQGRRDYAIAVCLINLGLRAVEVSRLRVDDINWRLKPSRFRLQRRVQAANTPAGTRCQRLTQVSASSTVHRCRGVIRRPNLLRGRPLSSWAIAAAMDRAYRRCGFAGWYGTHRLRHSFATRLFARGATTKEIADLLGHRLVATTDHYTQTKDLQVLRSHGHSHSTVKADLGTPVFGVSAQARVSHASRRGAPGFWTLRRSNGSGKAVNQRAGNPVGNRCALGSSEHPCGKARRSAWICPLLRVSRFTDADSRSLSARARLSASSPHLFTSAEISLILQRTQQLETGRSPLHPLTYETLIGLLASTGMRPGEALRLQCHDLDVEEGTLRIPRCKFSPERVLALHPTTVRALRHYRQKRQALFPWGETLFVGATGRPLSARRMARIFRRLTRGWLPRGKAHGANDGFSPHVCLGADFAMEPPVAALRP